MTNYFASDYENKSRWMSYWHQLKEISDFHPESVLIVGKGSGLVSEYLKLSGIKIITLDIDKSLSPDIIASVLDMPFKDNEFDAVLCAQVLEHLSYDDFGRAILEIRRVAKSGAVVSLPHFGPAMRFFFKLPLLPEIKFMIKLPYPIKHKFKGEHYWEIGKQGYPTGRVKKDIEKCWLTIARDFIVFENPLHHFFILKK